MKGLMMSCVVGLSVSAIGVSVAQPGFGPKGGQDLFDRLDTNGDGVITQEEAEAAKAQRQQRLQERAQHMATRALEVFDTDESGALDRDELAHLFASRPGEHARGKGAMGGPLGRAARMLGPEAIQEIDTDGDGTISKEEARAGRASIKAQVEAKRAEMVERFDLDDDGSLDSDERATLRRTLSAERRAGGMDLNNDGALDASELKRAAELIQAGSKEADFNGDGIVDSDDYATLVSLFPAI